jgi:NADPH-dependent curcumin reductase
MKRTDGNHQVILAKRPAGLPQLTDFEMRMIPLAPIGPDQALVQIIWLSIDGFMIARMRPEENYAAGVNPGDVMQAYGVGRVTQSNRTDRHVGDFVFGPFGMQQWAIDDGNPMTRTLDPAFGPIQSALGIQGISGWSAYFGLLDVGQPKPGETVAVSAGAGAVGALVGQIASLNGCKTIAIVGSEAKAAQTVGEYGYTASVVRGSSDFSERLKQAAPGGIDVYFDNVGGDLYDDVLECINTFGRVVVCGRLATAHLTDTAQDFGPRDHNTLLVKRIRKQGFLVSDYAARFTEATSAIAAWQAEGKIKLAEDVLVGLGQAPAALIRLVTGGNNGKQLVRIAE